MTSIVTVHDLEVRWRLLSTEEQEQAEALIEDSLQLLKDLGVDFNTASASSIRRVVCAMVKRSMLANDTAGVQSQSQSAGGFSEAYTFSNPAGDLYLTSAEKRSLGLTAQKAWSVSLWKGSTDV